MSVAQAFAMVTGFQPGFVGGLPEKPCPGSEGITIWNASATRCRHAPSDR